MVENFSDRSPFDAWDRGVLRDYCQYGLAPAGENYILACPPEIEASVYEASPAMESNIYAEIATIAVPVHVIRAGRFRDHANAMGASPTAPDLAARFAYGADTLLTEHLHFIPMESPQRVAKFVMDLDALL